MSNEEQTQVEQPPVEAEQVKTVAEILDEHHLILRGMSVAIMELTAKVDILGEAVSTLFGSEEESTGNAPNSDMGH